MAKSGLKISIIEVMSAVTLPCDVYDFGDSDGDSNLGACRLSGCCICKKAEWV